MCKIFVVTNVIYSNSMCTKKDGVVGGYCCLYTNVFIA